MKIEKAIIFGIFMMLTINFYGQQDPQYSHYMYNMNIVNPAYAGSQEGLSANFLGRSQWVGINGAPRTYTLGIHTPVGKKVGLGLSIIADKLGPVSEQSAYADFSYSLQVSENSKLALGLKAGFSFLDVNLQTIKVTNPNDLAFSERINKLLPNFGFGAFYHTDKFYAGISIPNMLKTLHYKKSNGSITKASDVSHYFITSGYVFDLNDNVKLKPSVMMKAVKGTPVSLDFSGNVLLYDKFEFGLSYRIDDSVSALVNTRVNENFRIGYAYDHTVSNLSQFNSGSHEIFLLYNFSFVRDKIKSPRFF